MTNPIPLDTTVRASDALAADPVKARAAAVELGSKQAQARAQLNQSILQASLSVSINSQNEPLALLFKTAIDSLNETLKADFGENAIQNAVEQDNTPEGTAGRIVSLSTAFFGAYKAQHPEQDQDTVLKNFIATIRGGFETGFKEAKDILSGLNVLNGDIASNIEKTHDLVLKGYADFEAAQSGSAKGAKKEA